MSGRTLRYWMWGYQEYFRRATQQLAADVLAAIGAPCEPEVLLVGVRIPDSTRADPVCIDPEAEVVPIAVFDGLAEAVELGIRHHPLLEIVYGDKPSMDDKPENIRRLVIIDQVKAKLASLDAEQQKTSFIGAPRQVGDYHVATVVRLPAAIIARHPEITVLDIEDTPRSHGFLRACISQILETATELLERPSPGRGLRSELRRPDELVRRAAAALLQAISTQLCEYRSGVDLFERLNAIAALRYEGDEGVGRLLLIDPRTETPDYVFELEQPVSFDAARWAARFWRWRLATWR